MVNIYLIFNSTRVANNIGAILVILTNIGQDNQYRANIVEITERTK